MVRRFDYKNESNNAAFIYFDVCIKERIYWKCSYAFYLLNMKTENVLDLCVMSVCYHYHLKVLLYSNLQHSVTIQLFIYLNF